MKNKDYSIELIVDKPIHEVFNSINTVAAWWTDDIKGSTEKLNDVFTVQFADMHISTQKIIELIPDKKIVWLVTDSHLSFLKDKSEWTNTEIHFELSRSNNQTHILFTHVGLVPNIECYKDCTKGWDYYVKGSLYKFLTEGKGTPGL
ncbi:SRPBCC domain-containing protein [Cytophaga aurantiaca]|uniref:SRPBCC domain-containing protein n=1 Tax=Cytophaga aurantiaca TaxID=29530 RepID=UPI0004761546|nr:SRPBCC domain-containing protein [Cytophaga aurantiaca]